MKLILLLKYFTAARLAQLGERRSAEREVVSSNPGRTNTQGLKITEEKVLSLFLLRKEILLIDRNKKPNEQNQLKII